MFAMTSKWTIRLLLVIGAFVTLGANVNCEESTDKYTLNKDCVQELQTQIGRELYASLVYLNMASHFHRGDIARKGFFRVFEEQSDDEKKHAHKLMHYITKRGAKVGPLNVPMPKKSEWTSAEEAVQDAIALEKELNEELHKIHKVAERTCNDPHLMDFLESEFLEEQISSISELNKLYTTLTSFDAANKQMGEYLVDKELVDEKGRKYYQEEL